MRTQSPRRSAITGRWLLACLLLALALVLSGVAMWCWTQVAVVTGGPRLLSLSLADARVATWRLLGEGLWSDPARAFPAAAERANVPGAGAFTVALLVCVALGGGGVWWGHRRLRRWGAGSPLGLEQLGVRRRAIERGWVRHRTWARPYDLQRLWVTGPAPGRPYLGWIGRAPPRMLAAEVEVQPLVVAPPRAGKSTGYVVPWLLDHAGPALVLSTKRDVYEATVAFRERVGRVWVYDPFGDPDSAGFTPLIPAGSWSGALRAGEALASAAHPDQANAASEFWDKEAAILLAPLLHAAAISDGGMDAVLHWLDIRAFKAAAAVLEGHGALDASDLLKGVSRRDPRNRETTVMAATNLLRAYRYPEVARLVQPDLTPQAFLDGGANTIYVVASDNDQQKLRSAILALITAVYDAAIVKARRDGPLVPRLFMLLDEAANIAPVRDLAPWMSQCGDYGVMIATIWQSIAQIDQRYGRPARDAILAAATAQVFIPPLADPTTTGYVGQLLGEEPVAQGSRQRNAPLRETLSVTHRQAASPPWLRQIPRGRALLVYRDLPPAAVRAPGWFEDPRFTRYARSVTGPARDQARPHWRRHSNSLAAKAISRS
jgi:type IV secretory pathway TraG/TraD family ATPase VirD4